jgi:hypothetical protein
VAILTLVWGFSAFLCMVVGLLPNLYYLNWFIVPFAAVGILLCIAGLVALSKQKDAFPIAGLVSNVIAAAVAVLRLRGGSGF